MQRGGLSLEDVSLVLGLLGVWGFYGFGFKKGGECRAGHPDSGFFGSSSFPLSCTPDRSEQNSGKPQNPIHARRSLVIRYTLKPETPKLQKPETPTAAPTATCHALPSTSKPPCLKKNNRYVSKP